MVSEPSVIRESSLLADLKWAALGHEGELIGDVIESGRYEIEQLRAALSEIAKLPPSAMAEDAGFALNKARRIAARALRR